jgi:hypothetical protein
MENFSSGILVLLLCLPHFVLNVPVLKRRTLVSVSVPLMHSLRILWLVHGFLYQKVKSGKRIHVFVIMFFKSVFISLHDAYIS